MSPAWKSDRNLRVKSRFNMVHSFLKHLKWADEQDVVPQPATLGVD